MRTCALIIACLVCSASAAQAQWWPFAPRDYEDCAAQVEKSDLTKEARANQLSECDAKFSGRRKPGGGYTYYDFMQERSFDIAGPNPTPDEQKKIDQEYTAYLDRQRHSAIVAALTDKQRQQNEEAEIHALMTPPPTTGSIAAAKPVVPTPRPAPRRIQQAAKPHCDTRLSCTWTDLSDGVRNLFGAPPKSRPPARI